MNKVHFYSDVVHPYASVSNNGKGKIAVFMPMAGGYLSGWPLFSEVAYRAGYEKVFLGYRFRLVDEKLSEVVSLDKDNYPVYNGREDMVINSAHSQPVIALNPDGMKNLFRLISLSFTRFKIKGKPYMSFDDLIKLGSNMMYFVGGDDGFIWNSAKAGNDVSSYLKRASERFSSIVLDEGSNEYMQNMSIYKDYFNLPVVNRNDLHTDVFNEDWTQALAMCGVNYSISSTLSEEGAVSNNHLYDILSQFDGSSSWEYKCDSISVSTPTIDRLYPEIKDKPSMHKIWHILKSKSFMGFEEDEVKKELRVIHNKKMTDLFLIVTDILHFCKLNGILTSYGRGSAVSSLVSFILGITNINPKNHGLVFERFLSEHTEDPPDIDFESPKDKYGLIIEYISQSQNGIVSRGIVHNTHSGREAVEIAGRFYGLTDTEIKTICSVSEPLDYDMEKVLASNSSGIFSKPLVVYSIVAASKLRHIYTNPASHPSAVYIFDKKIKSQLPFMFHTAKYDAVGKRALCVQFDDKSSNVVSFLKIDILSSKNLSLLNEIITLIREGGEDIDIWSLPFDPVVFDTIINKPSNIPYLSSFTHKVVSSIRPKSISEIMFCISISKPGANKFIEEAVRAKLSGKINDSIINDKKDRLKDTYGILVYQEQLSHIISDLTGWDFGYSELMRKNLSENKFMERWKQEFTSAFKDKKSSAVDVYDYIVSESGYLYNKANASSAATQIYVFAYLKTHYPLQFTSSIFRVSNSRKDMIEVVNSAIREGTKIMPPNINLSSIDFSVIDGEIFYGLSGIKGITIDSASKIIKERSNGLFKDFEDVISRLFLTQSLSKSALSAIVKCGATDSFGDRAWMISVLDVWDSYLSSLKKYEKGQRKSAPKNPTTYPSYTPFTTSEMANMEKNLIGGYFTVIGLSNVHKAYQDISDMDYNKNNGSFSFRFGILTGVTSKRFKKSGKSDYFYICNIEVDGVELTVNAWDPAIIERSNVISGDRVMVSLVTKLESDTPSLVSIHKEEDFCNSVSTIAIFKPADDDVRFVCDTLDLSEAGPVKVYVEFDSEYYYIGQKKMTSSILNLCDMELL